MDHEPSVDGVVVLDKATGITSAGAVEQVKRALDLDARARVLVQAHPALLDRRVHGRDLVLLAQPDCRLERLARHRDLAALEDRAAAIERVGGDAEDHLGFVFFVFG